jgi:NADH-quinone oxidoreductase subunit D
MDLGAFTVMLWTFIEREKLYDIFENVTGARLTTSYTRVGGLLRDVPPDFEEMVRKFMTKCSQTIDEIEAVLNNNRIFTDRCKGVSPVPRDVAISFGFTGPMLRAAGVPYDVRKARPYSGSRTTSSTVTEERRRLVRYRVRVREMRESIKITTKPQDDAQGPIYVDDPASCPAQDGDQHAGAAWKG